LSLRAAAALLCLVSAFGACSPSKPAPSPIRAAPALHVTPVSDLVPAAGLTFLVLAKPREIAARADLIPALHELVPEGRFSTFAERNALDLRALDEIAIARYAESTLYVATGRMDATRIEGAFAQHLVLASGRAIDRSGDDLGRIVRVWGESAAGREQLVLLGQAAVALEQGKVAASRAVGPFAEGRLKKASPALRAGVLAQASAILGEAPLRLFMPGPFDAEPKALGGLLAASTAVGVAVRFPPAPAGQTTTPAQVTLALLGGWKDDANAAAERLLAVIETIAESPLARLCGVNRPLVPAKARAGEGAILIDVTVDVLAVTRGLHAAMDAQIDEIMRYGVPHAAAPLTPVP
jgi:hypothetical protein